MPYNGASTHRFGTLIMSMGTRQHRQRQEDLWITHIELVQAPAHPFYQRLNELLDGEKFDQFVEKECAGFYAVNNGRPSLTPGIYFRLLPVGLFRWDRFGTRHRLAGRGPAGTVAVSWESGWTRARAGSLDHFSDTAGGMLGGKTM
jgi:hypothetical protein